MGFHYVPRDYLRNFEDPTRCGFVWASDQASERPRQLPIASVAQAPKFYDNAVEYRLANEIESPANSVMRKVCAEQSIDSEERQSLSRYIAVMLRRVPFSRQMGLKLLPAVLEDTIAEIRSPLIEAQRNPSVDQKLLDVALSEVDRIHEKFKREPPKVIIEQLRRPWASPEMVNLINTMTWRILKASGPCYFLTSDNPAFFFSAYGLGREEAELTFPLSSSWALHGCWQGTRGDLKYVPANQALVKEVNRRVASTSRFAYYGTNERWVGKLLQNPNPFLSWIKW